MEQQDLLQHLEEEIYFERASTGARFLNYIIDLICFYILLFVTSFVIGILTYTEEGTNAFGEESSGLALVYMMTFILYLGYYIILEKFAKGRTIGKLITGTRVVKTDGTAITLQDAFLRTLSRFVPFEPFSALTGNPWYDSWTSTQVVKVRR
jgi:uncharacterized RDD family membrane protein YckC